MSDRKFKHACEQNILSLNRIIPWLFTICIALIASVPNTISAQVKWDGEAGDGQWNNAINWVGDQLPDIMDDVILDNGIIVSDYTVYLPQGDSAVNIGSLAILPGGKTSITVVIPNASKSAPALLLGKPGYGLTIGNGGVLINSSGASAGAVIQLADSVFIGNGGRYIHHTQRSHADFVTRLSRALLTEEGEFEFRVPSASSTISLSDRVFGKLVLSADSGYSLINYTAAATNPIVVRSHLVIEKNVRLNLNCSDTFLVKKNLFLTGSKLDLATTNRSLVMRIEGNLVADTGSVITRSGNGEGTLLLGGRERQYINAGGMIAGGVSIRLFNASGFRLQNPWILNTELRLEEGNIITDSINILVVDEAGSLIADSLKRTAFIDGPLVIKRNVLQDHTLFPTGNAGQLHWMALRNWSGIAQARYIPIDPHVLSNNQKDVDHFSLLGYWTMIIDSLSTNPLVEISFNDAQSSGVTDMGSLTMVKLQKGIWTNTGVSGFTGSAGANGSVISASILWEPGFEKFAFASMDKSQNPLPIDTSRHSKGFSNRLLNHDVQIWKISRTGMQLALEVYSERRERLKVIMVNTSGQIIYSREQYVDRGKNLIYCYSNHVPIGIIHIFGLFSNNKTNTVTVW